MYNYFEAVEKKSLASDGYKVSVLKNPERGTLKATVDASGNEAGGYYYLPAKDYLGPDRATFLVETGGLKIKVEYSIQVVTVADERLYEDIQYCPNGEYWRISFNPDDPSRATNSRLHNLHHATTYHASHRPG